MEAGEEFRAKPQRSDAGSVRLRPRVRYRPRVGATNIAAVLAPMTLFLGYLFLIRGLVAVWFPTLDLLPAQLPIVMLCAISATHLTWSALRTMQQVIRRATRGSDSEADDAWWLRRAELYRLLGPAISIACVLLVFHDCVSSYS